MSVAANLYMWRIDVWKATEAAARAMGAPPSLKIEPHDVPKAASRGYQTVVRIADADCLDVAHAMKERGLRPVVLNLSDDCAAGGCIDIGSGAQEESLWRRTALCVTQTQDFYPLGRSLIYSPAVPVLRDTETYDYAWLTKPWAVDFIACPAIKYPKWVSTTEEPDGDLNDADKEELAARLQLILDTAATMGNDAVVLGPMGCGAWKNPPRAVARVFRRVLLEYPDCFREIAIAALTTGTPYAGQKTNAQIFATILGGPSASVSLP